MPMDFVAFIANQTQEAVWSGFILLTTDPDKEILFT